MKFTPNSVRIQKNMEITQIQLSYLELEDRMVMRINLGENKHLAFLLTRRICRFMLENLNAFLGISVPNDLTIQAVSPEISFKEQHKKESLDPFADFDLKSPFQERKVEDNLLPTGNEQVLVVNAACNRGLEGISFTFFMQATECLNLNLPRKLALGIHQLMAQIAIQTQWFSGLTQISAPDVEPAYEESEQTKTTTIYH